MVGVERGIGGGGVMSSAAKFQSLLSPSVGSDSSRTVLDLGA